MPASHAEDVERPDSQCESQVRRGAGGRADVGEMLYGDNYSSIFSIFHNLWCFYQNWGVGDFLTAVAILKRGDIGQTLDVKKQKN